MKQFMLAILVICLISLSTIIEAQNSSRLSLDSLFNDKGEVYFKFSIQNRDDIHMLTQVISIDNVRGSEVFAYANRKEFTEFLLLNLTFTILPNPGTLLSEFELNPFSANDLPKDRTQWNFYPSYQQYIDYMVGFALANPGICRLDTVGISTQGRLILAVKISDNVGREEAEPQFLYTSTMHGDETTGYVLMLHLIDYLLSNYGLDTTVTRLVNSTEIFINPLANPDGTYHGGNNSVYGATRYNANYIDLNRNFPDPKTGQHPDGNPWQAETEAWMTYAGNNHFSMSANFHGGAEVFNFPWDTWYKLNADDNWWHFIGREWADTVHKNGIPGYFTFLDNGITNGYAWYEVNGGRQDYMNYWHQCREATVEISDVKLLPASQLISFWNYNYHSFLNYIEQSNFGFNGIISDTVTGEPIVAKVFIPLLDKDNSEVYSRLPSGFYARPIFEGLYNVTFWAPGYYTKTIENVSISKWTTTNLDIKLRPLAYDVRDKVTRAKLVYPNPSDGHFRLILPENAIVTPCSFQVINTMGSVVYSAEINIMTGSSTIDLDISNLPGGLYLLKFISGDLTYSDKLIIKR
ncbi:MAG: M14 family zinc carboxypeptidase [Bacteroidota bacterium]